MLATYVELFTTGSRTSKIKLRNLLFTLLFAYDLKISTSNEHPHFYVLLNEVVLARFRFDYKFIGRKFRFCGYCIFLTRLYFFIEENLRRRFTNTFTIDPYVLFQSSSQACNSKQV